jgi:hypothetical protein
VDASITTTMMIRRRIGRRAERTMMEQRVSAAPPAPSS